MGDGSPPLSRGASFFDVFPGRGALFGGAHETILELTRA